MLLPSTLMYSSDQPASKLGKTGLSFKLDDRVVNLARRTLLTGSAVWLRPARSFHATDAAVLKQREGFPFFYLSSTCEGETMSAGWGL